MGGEISDFEDGNSTDFAAISYKERRNPKKNYRKKSNAMNIPFRHMGKIRKNGKKRMRNWNQRSDN